MSGAEKDPHGTDPHALGAKLDHGKARLGLVLGGFRRALFEVGRVGTFGAEKYSDGSWLHVPDGAKRYRDAHFRHMLQDGDDADSGMSHKAHAAWNALAELELELIERERADGAVVWPSEDRIDAIGQNGGDGAHYAAEMARG